MAQNIGNCFEKSKQENTADFHSDSIHNIEAILKLFITAILTRDTLIRCQMECFLHLRYLLFSQNSRVSVRYRANILPTSCVVQNLYDALPLRTSIGFC